MNETKDIEIKSTRNALETFWRDHYEGFHKSDLSGAKYCRQHQLAYHRFLYWQKKFNRDSNTKKNKLASANSNFLPVHLHSASDLEMDSSVPALCTLELGFDQRLVIHTPKAIAMVLNVLRGNQC